MHNLQIYLYFDLVLKSKAREIANPCCRIMADFYWCSLHSQGLEEHFLYGASTLKFAKYVGQGNHVIHCLRCQKCSPIDSLILQSTLFGGGGGGKG